MSILQIIKDGAAKWQRASPASATALEGLTNGAGVALPEDYLTFLLHCNGGEGQLGVEPGWFQIWPAEEVLEFQVGYHQVEFIPGFFGFGSSGGGDLIAFDTRGDRPWPIVTIPFIPMEPKYATVVAHDFTEFIQKMGYQWIAA